MVGADGGFGLPTTRTVIRTSRTPCPVNPGPLSQFGELLRHHRLSAGLSQEHLAERAGISLAAVNMLERGVRRAPYVHTVLKLADALGLAGADRAAFEAAGAPA